MKTTEGAGARVSIGSIRRAAGTSSAAADGIVRALGEGLAGAAGGLRPEELRGARVRLPALAIRLSAGAGAGEIAAAVRRALAVATGERRR